jgi:hypothetical protein
MHANMRLTFSGLFILLMTVHWPAQAFNKRILFVTCPLPIYPDEYGYDLYTSYVNPERGWDGMPLTSWNVDFEGDQKTMEYEILSNFEGNFVDTLVRIKYTISNTYTKTNRYRPGTYVYLDTVISVNADTLRFVIPPIDNPAEIIAFLAEEDRKYQEAHKGEAFRSFVNYWESRFLYVSYYQGNRPFAEVLFGPARYLEMPEQVFKGPDVPAVILGPQAGAEINFNWDPDKLIIGPKLGVAVCNRTIAMGLHFIYYTDFDRGQLFLTPRLGFSPWSPFVNFAYAYSMRLGKDKFSGAVNRHQFCLIFNLPLKRVRYY